MVAGLDLNAIVAHLQQHKESKMKKLQSLSINERKVEGVKYYSKKSKTYQRKKEFK